MKSFKKLFLSFAATVALALGFATSASAGCDYGLECITVNTTTTPPAVAAPMGITISGWTQSGAVGVGQTTGSGRIVTGEVVTMTNEKFTLGATTFVTGNANPNCSVACADSQSRLSIEGTSMAGAASVGYASGNGTTPVSSISQTGTNAAFTSSLMQKWTPTPAPTSAP
jgi:hypothetical protein